MKRGVCPTVFAPMATGDGLLARIKPPNSLLTAAQARAVASAATAYGNGMVQLTTRACLQLRGLQPDGVAPFAATMVAAGLAHPDPAVEARRTIVVGMDPHAASIATALSDLLAADGRLAALPAKFGFLVDGGGALGLSGVTADIEIRLATDRCRIALDASRMAAEIDPAQAADAAVRLTLAFLALGGTGRMAALVDAIGEDALYAAAGLSATVPIARGKPSIAVGPLQSPLPLAGEGWVRVVNQPALEPPSPQPSPARGRGSQHLCAFGAGLPFGMTGARNLEALATLTEAHGDGLLRVTPWRAIVIAGVHDPASLRTALAPLDLITDPADPRLNIFACPGRPGCASATVDTHRAAAELATLRLPGSIHVSGCSKGCAHPAPAALTLVGRDGAFDLVRNGRAADPPAAFGLTDGRALAVPA